VARKHRFTELLISATSPSTIIGSGRKTATEVQVQSLGQGSGNDIVLRKLGVAL
jgi:hypothetical protein